ncbi:hypothetical protein FUA23_17850 [Neolewinella aurantiaca]|uniref:Uncharacterized protein n=1 Tax=Neolewinella aurantiaca TaxID=2602767 RepID=A0A5C7FSK7_9BACT|nr:hypothetical protein [Neolewinella aurantiaca]TXF87675.1 hypothetical protein FUA23_17850 [Neolewinella aurantiaca]
MRSLLNLIPLLLLTLAFTSCGADGNIDAALVQEYAERFQKEVLPTKEEFKKIAEEQIVRMPAEEQAEARKSLEETLAEWPTDGEITEAISEAVNDLPSRSEINEALRELDEAPGGSMISKMIRGAMDEAPSGSKVNGLVEKSLDEMEAQADEIRARAKD